MCQHAETTSRMAEVWSELAPRFAAYELVLPGVTPSFICQAEACTAHCCRVFSVSLGDREVQRMERASGLQPIHFLESEDGAPITLPLAQPYLLARAEGRCALLGDDLRCSQYHGRPDACRLYPHFVIFVDPASGRPVHSDLPRMAAAMDANVGRPDNTPATTPEPPDAGLVALLLRHIECPGFTGPPLEDAAWAALFCETWQLQFGHLMV